jgi:hypothetical protein
MRKLAHTRIFATSRRKATAPHLRMDKGIVYGFELPKSMEMQILIRIHLTNFFEKQCCVSLRIEREKKIEIWKV